MEYQHVNQWPFTEHALLQEVQDMLSAILSSAEACVFGHGTLRPALGMGGADDRLWRDNVELAHRSIPDAMNLLYRVHQVLPARVEPSDIDVHRYPATFTMRALYDYIVHSRWADGVHLDDVLGHAITFVEMAQAADEISGEYGAPRRCLAVIERAKARGKLDHLRSGWMQTIWTEEGNLTFSDLAYLAEVEEKTVRNATLRTDGRKLHTVVIDGKRIVEPEEAARWLALQSGFRPTEFYRLPEQEVYAKHANISDHFQSWNFPKPEKAEVIRLRAVPNEKADQSDPCPPSAEVTLSENNIRSKSLRLTPIIDRFPLDVIGGSSKRDLAPAMLTVEFSDESMCITDIDGRKNILRDRAAIGRFYQKQGLKAGDKIRITWLEKRRIRLERLSE